MNHAISVFLKNQQIFGLCKHFRFFHVCLLENNLDKKQLKAIKELKTKMNKESLVCYKTDKTDKLAIDTVENYSSKMEKHIKNDMEVSEKKVTTIENRLNEHMEHWVRVTNAGEKTG